MGKQNSITISSSCVFLNYFSKSLTAYSISFGFRFFRNKTQAKFFSFKLLCVLLRLWKLFLQLIFRFLLIRWFRPIVSTMCMSSLHLHSPSWKRLLILLMRFIFRRNLVFADCFEHVEPYFTFFILKMSRFNQIVVVLIFFYCFGS